MACPACGCKTTYQFCGGDDLSGDDEDLERCASCGHVFFTDEHLPEEDDDDQDARQ